MNLPPNPDPGLPTPAARRALAVPLLALLALLSACGGAADSAAPAIETARAPEARVAATFVTPLVDDQGIPAATDPRAVPADAAVWRRGALYATEAQAQQIVRALGDDVLQLRVGCCSYEAVDEAVGIAWGLQAARDLPASTAVLVSGPDLRLAAAAARRLNEGGLTRVWLVTP